jgi:DNA-binding response OmpR family regulator
VKALVIENNNNRIALAASRMLKQQFSEIAFIKDTKEALYEEVLDQKPDLLLITVSNSNSDGKDILFIKTMRKLSNIPIIAVSDRREIDCLVQYLGAGADEYISDLYRAAEFNARIRAVMSRYRN